MTGLSPPSEKRRERWRQRMNLKESPAKLVIAKRGREQGRTCGTFGDTPNNRNSGKLLRSPAKFCARSYVDGR